MADKLSARERYANEWRNARWEFECVVRNEGLPAAQGWLWAVTHTAMFNSVRLDLCRTEARKMQGLAFLALYNRENVRS